MLSVPSAKLSSDSSVTARDAANLAVLNGITQQRQASNYAFIAINLFIISVDFALSIYCVQAPVGSVVRFYGLIVSAAFGTAALPLAIYWLRELREFQLLQETMFQSLMDEERIYSDRGTLSRFWDRVGDLPGRDSAVFSVKIAKLLPLLFVSLQIVPLYANLIFWMDHHRFEGLPAAARAVEPDSARNTSGLPPTMPAPRSR